MGRDKDAELKREIETHLDLEAEDRVAAGASEEEAYYAARRAFGNVTRTQEEVRSVWTRPWLDAIVKDLGYAVRTLRKSPGFAATAVVSLAVGIAAATGLFSIVNAALLNPFPFADINRIIRLDMTDKGKPRGLSVTARQLVALQQSDVFDGAFASNSWEMTLTGRGSRKRCDPVFFSKRFERSRGSAPPRTSLQRGGRAGGRTAPTGRRAHLSVLAATLRRAA